MENKDLRELKERVDRLEKKESSDIFLVAERIENEVIARAFTSDSAIKRMMDNVFDEYKDKITPKKDFDYFDGVIPVKGVDYFDGEDGAKGEDGKDGKTPIKYVDYFTEDDVNEICGKVITILDETGNVNGTPGEMDILAIRDALENLPDEDKLDFYKVFSEVGLVKQEDMDRAISILDQRTQFLINKQGGSGVSTFLALTDTPSSYSGQGTKFIRVNSSETALEFATISGGGDALTSAPLSQFAATTSAQLAGVMSDETGSGSLVFSNSPTLVTPNLGTPSAINLANATNLNLATGVTGDLPFSNIAQIATDRLLGRSSAGTGDIEQIVLTAAGRALIDDADAAAQRTTLGLGTLATQSGTFSGSSSGTNTGDQNIFTTIAVSGQSNVVADSTSDTLTLVAGSGVTITTDATTDSVTISATGGGGTNLFTANQSQTAARIHDQNSWDFTVNESGTWTFNDSGGVNYVKLIPSQGRIDLQGGASDISQLFSTSFGFSNGTDSANYALAPTSSDPWVTWSRGTAVNWYTGSGSPETVIVADIGSQYIDFDTGILYYKNADSGFNTGWVTYSGGGGGAVSSVFGRTGTVTAASGDYNAGQITNTAAGNISSTTVQAAINELDSEKQASLVSGTNIKTVGGVSLLGSGDVGTLGVAYGGTGRTSISALSIWAANSANTLTEITATAGQSIRVNAGGTAWEAYTPGTGGGDVTKSGTPVNNQLAVWTADGVIEGQNDLLNDGTNLSVAMPNVITSTTQRGQLNIRSTNAQNSDVGGALSFGGFNDTAGTVERVFGTVEGRKENNTSGNSSGYLAFKTNNAGTLTTWLRISSAGVIATQGAANITVNTPGTSAGSVATIDGTQTLTNKSIAATQLTGTLDIARFSTNQRAGQITFRIDGGGAAITTGAKKIYHRVAYSCTITSWDLVADTSGSIVIDVWKDTYANFAPTVADTITGTAKPTLSSQQKNTSSTLTGWTTTLNAGDYIEINVDSASTVTLAILTLVVTRT